METLGTPHLQAFISLVPAGLSPGLVFIEVWIAAFPIGQLWWWWWWWSSHLIWAVGGWTRLARSTRLTTVDSGLRLICLYLCRSPQPGKEPLQAAHVGAGAWPTASSTLLFEVALQHVLWDENLPKCFSSGSTGAKVAK